MILLPLLGFLVLGLWGRSFKGQSAGVLASLMVLGSFVLTLVLLFGGGASFEVKDWLPGIPFALLLDNLAGYMALIVTGIGFLIHVYAIGYMADDPGKSRFFAYFNFFIAMMLTLVLADAYPVMFIGWEGVGLASFLLIGFWFEDQKNADSARKAFIVNRIGDLGFLLGMALLYSLFGTLQISELREIMEKSLVLPAGLGLAGLLLFIGAIGKSAQLPLMVWLPDAMAGPTPVSALIHAATMVTAGVYLLARSSFLYANLPDVSYWIALVGLLTALYGALSALGQWDIKRIVAYSTISQLGYMFLAAGVGAYWIALFHVMTHAFYKALLFLSSGSVIHALGGEQDVRKMGGLKKYLPQTHIHGLIGALSLAGFPLFAGFWSKDAILASTLNYPFGGYGFYLVGLFTAFLTALYAMRWYVLVFLGDFKGQGHPHEAPPVMAWPNHLLAVGAALAGFLALPEPFWNLIERFLAPSLWHLEVEPLGVTTEWGLLSLSAVVAVVGLYAGYRLFLSRLPDAYLTFQRAAENAFYVDWLYNTLIVGPLKELAFGFGLADRGLDRGYVRLGGGVGLLGRLLARLQGGYVRVYAFFVVVAATVFVLWGVVR